MHHKKEWVQLPYEGALYQSLGANTNPVEIFQFQPDFSAFSKLFPMENSVTFPSDPNPTQTGIKLLPKSRTK